MKDPIPTYDNEVSIRELLERYTRYWYLFALGVIVSLVIAKIYLRYTTATYLSQATVIIKDEKEGNGIAELAAFSQLGGILRKFGNNKIENELAIFKSRRIIKEAIKTLDLNVTYESIGTIKTTELYGNRPFVVRYLSLVDSLTQAVPKLTITPISNTEFKMESIDVGDGQVFSFGEKIDLSFGQITVLPEVGDAIMKKFIDKSVLITYTDPDKIASKYQKRLQVVNEIQNSNVVSISLESAVPDKAEDFINELIFQYNKDAINDRGQVAKKTSDFIDSRLEIITRELDSVEGNKEDFKSSNRLTDIEAEAQLVLQSASEFEKRQFDLNTQMELANTMIDYMEGASPNDLLPSNIGIESESVTEAVNNYNALILQRNRLLKTSTAKNPVIVNINQQLKGIRSNILNSLKNSREGLKLTMKELNFQESSLNQKLTKVPTQEKIYRGIERQQMIKEQLYLFLLQQREEASISLAITAPKAKVVDEAITTVTAINPNKPLIYLGAGLAGLLLPFLFLYSSYLLNNKINDRRDVERTLPGINLIGEVPKLKKDDKQLIQLNDRSVLAESFRILRTNLQYLFINKLDKSHMADTVFVTSTIKGEGKTFVAFNLALTVALTGKKVALVGADIRNPQLHRYISEKEINHNGLTEYIMDSNLTANDVRIPSTDNQNLDIVLSGAIPPNPAELLMSDRTTHLFDELKELYDFIVVDTAPSMLVTDTILINKMADVTLYVLRANYTEKRLLEFTKDAIDDERLNNVALVLNGVSMNNFGYGNKYGYSYSDEKKSFLKRMFNA